MKLESLPNEIVLILFENFSLFELFQYFRGLNSRFSNLLYQEFYKFQLDLRSLSKTRFEQICQAYVPSIRNQIVSIHLSNDSETPQAIQLFLSQGYKLRQFIHLAALLISNLPSKEAVDEIMNECSHLSHLRHLTIEGIAAVSENDKQNVFNQVWSLPKLESVRLSISSSAGSFCNSTVISKSLKYLNIQQNTYSLATFADLCHHTPNLRHLSGSFTVEYYESQILKPINSITRLNIAFQGCENMFEHVLENLPNLYQLRCDLNDYISGYQWENIIRKSLPKLKIFQMKMRFSPSDNPDKEEQLNELISPYRTNFWINEHQWFVRCHWYTIDEKIDQFGIIDLFTVPDSLDRFWEHNICLLAKSTAPYDDEYLQCPRITSLRYGSLSLRDPILSRCRFNNIDYLLLSLPCDEQLFCIVPKFDRLRSLFVYTDKSKNLNNIQFQLQLILDKAPRLHSLEFTTWSRDDSKTPLAGLHNASVHRLNLVRLNFNGQNYHFDEQECMELCLSPLGAQCETLIITIKNKRNILTLINNMPHLRSLHVRSLDHYWPTIGSVSSPTEVLVQWLRQQLPSTCTVTVDNSLGIYVWIG
ncbi:unnamed protein product [Adineta ricciae]|uniref:F-box domain-containing protein n=1 Tax=Adineta ricciae TaxID=249248 RepID=A0A815SQY7_ADIRI|nr:unnamed protein product [Adineta ricciae]CAF1637147.1 unnamed protein product [Adineta ricciae]